MTLKVNGQPYPVEGKGIYIGGGKKWPFGVQDGRTFGERRTSGGPNGSGRPTVIGRPAIVKSVTHNLVYRIRTSEQGRTSRARTPGGSGRP